MSDESGGSPAGGRGLPDRGSVPPPRSPHAAFPTRAAPPGPSGSPAPAPDSPSAAPRAIADLHRLDSRRLGARLIDWGLAIAVAIAVGALLGARRWEAFVLVLWLEVVYFFVAEATTGQTVGKRLLGLRVVRRDGQPPRANAVAARNVIRVFEEPVIALVAMVGSGRRRRQRIGDLAAGTTVGRAAASRRPRPSRLVLVYPVLWAATGLVFTLVAAPLQPHERAGGYPPAPSLAGPMSPQWQQFAAAVDRACAVNFNAGQAAAQRVAGTQGLDRRARGTAQMQAQAGSQQATYDAAVALGAPPARPRLFRRWVENVGTRAELMRRRAIAWNRGDARRKLVLDLRIMALKIDADLMAQRFGLRICPSNGPARAWEARDLAPADARREYLGSVNRVCLHRNAREDQLRRRRGIATNDVVDLSHGETLNIAAIAPPPGEYRLRNRILALKRRLDRASREVIRQVAPSHDQERALARLLPGLNRLSDRTQARLQAVGLADCGNWGAAPAPSQLGSGEAELPSSRP